MQQFCVKDYVNIVEKRLLLGSVADFDPSLIGSVWDADYVSLEQAGLCV